MARLPKRLPIGDRFTGFLLRDAERPVLAFQALDGLEVVAQGELVLRYGIEYLGKPQLSIVPELLALDYGEALNGEAAWDFILNRSNLYPRADVLGYTNGGMDEMIVLKKLDLVQPVHVLVYADEQTRQALARVRALIGAEAEAAMLAPRLRGYLTLFSNLDEWQKQHG